MIAVCTHCDNEFYVPVELGGKTVNCSKCKKPVKAPDKPSVSEISFEPEPALELGVGSKPSETSSEADGNKDNPPAAGPKTGSPTGPAERVQYVIANAPKAKSKPKRVTKPAINPPSKSIFMRTQDSLTDVQLDGSSRQINLRKGFNRLAIVISVLSAIAVGAVRYFYFRDPTVISAETPIEVVLPWALGTFGLVWVVYLIGVFISWGFKGPWRVLTGGWIRLAFVVSILPLIPGMIKCGQYLAKEPSWRFEQIYEFFLGWPIYSFGGVWLAFWLMMFVASGFRNTNGAVGKTVKKEKRAKNKKPIEVAKSPAAKKQSWRTS